MLQKPHCKAKKLRSKVTRSLLEPLIALCWIGNVRHLFGCWIQVREKLLRNKGRVAWYEKGNLGMKAEMDRRVRHT